MSATFYTQLELVSGLHVELLVTTAGRAMGARSVGEGPLRRPADFCNISESLIHNEEVLILLDLINVHQGRYIS